VMASERASLGYSMIQYCCSTGNGRSELAKPSRRNAQGHIIQDISYKLKHAVGHPRDFRLRFLTEKRRRDRKAETRRYASCVRGAYCGPDYCCSISVEGHIRSFSSLEPRHCDVRERSEGVEERKTEDHVPMNPRSHESLELGRWGNRSRRP
jgi:hypothetical protein